MKRLLIAPLLLTLIVGCSNTDKSKTDKTFIERRDACADFFIGVMSKEKFIKFVGLEEEKEKFFTRAAYYCSFYGLREIR